MLSNYRVFFKGILMSLINEEKVNSVLHDMRVVTAETAFVVRTFFFIIFGWSVFLGSLLSFKTIFIGLIVVAIIYFVRGFLLFIFSGKDIFLELFLAPRGLVTILLFFAIPKELSVGKEFEGVLLFVVLLSCIVMAWALVSYKNKLEIKKKENENESPKINLDSEKTITEKNNENY